MVSQPVCRVCHKGMHRGIEPEAGRRCGHQCYDGERARITNRDLTLFSAFYERIALTSDR